MTIEKPSPQVYNPLRRKRYGFSRSDTGELHPLVPNETIIVVRPTHRYAKPDMSSELSKAINFLFDETYRMWKSDLSKIFRIGTRGAKGGCNLSSCILVLIGIESFSKFFSKKRTDVDKFADFIDKYYPPQYHGKMKGIYELFRHGLAHNYYPKSEFNLKNTSKIAFGVDKRNRVVALSRLRKDLDNLRKRTLKLSPKAGSPYVIVPQVLFLDTINVMEGLKKKIKSDSTLQDNFVASYKVIRKILRHGN